MLNVDRWLFGVRWRSAGRSLVGDDTGSHLSQPPILSSQSPASGGLWLVQTDHVTWILASDWLGCLWPETLSSAANFGLRTRARTNTQTSHYVMSQCLIYFGDKRYSIFFCSESTLFKLHCKRTIINSKSIDYRSNRSPLFLSVFLCELAWKKT